MDGRVLTEILEPPFAAPAEPVASPTAVLPEVSLPLAYTEEEDAAIQQRLADLGYL